MLTILQQSLQRGRVFTPQMMLKRPKTLRTLMPFKLHYRGTGVLQCQPFTTSLVTQNYRETAESKIDSVANLSSVPHRVKDAHLIPDYNVSEERLSLQRRNIDKRTALEHPLEEMAKATRAANDPYTRLTDRQVLITNLPRAETPELTSELAVKEFLVKNVHKDLQVKKVEFKDSITTAQMRERVAFIKVELGSKRQAQMVRSSLKKTWLHDSLLKVKTRDDIKQESFGNRTVVLHGIPKYLNSENVLDYFCGDINQTEKLVGAVVGIELPQENIKLRDLRHKIADQEDQPQNVEKEIDRRRALLAVQDGLNAQQVHEQAASTDLIEANRYNVVKLEESSNLEQERISGVIRLITRLQAEGKSVLEQKLTLLEIKERAAAEGPAMSLAAMQKEAQEVQNAAEQGVSIERLRETIEANQEQVQHTLEYLKQNREEVAMKVTSDPLSDLLRLGKEELAVAYDRLIEALSDRERAIEERLRKSIEHYGIEERILLQGKDFAKELEDVPNVGVPTNDNAKPEDIISVSQQVFNVLNSKTVDPKEKVYQLLSKTLNPFETKYNFQEAHLQDTTNPEFDQYKVANAPDPRIPRSLQKLFYQGTDFLPEHQAQVQKIIDDQKANMDVPFDELYHAEKQVIQDVIDAEKALKAKQDSLPHPMDNMKIDTSKLTSSERGSVQAILDKIDSPFSVSQRRRKEDLIDDRLREVKAGSHTGAYKFDYSETADLQSQIRQGLITQKHASQIQQLIAESQDENLGYAFVTFSHSDEARLFIMEHPNPFFEYDQIDIFLKSQIDHSNMDMRYFMAMARNEAKTVNEVQAVLDARERLRSFEKEMDKELPSRKRLQKFRRFAQSLIEDHRYMDRTTEQFGELRTELDRERLDRKMKEFEKEHPHIDLTAAYENDKTEAVRRTLHKKAYASYKAFHFLKHGVKGSGIVSANDEANLSEAKQRLRDKDPYNFPELDRTVKTVLSSDINVPQLNDIGTKSQRPGRRMGYSQQEYVEDYFGKDMTRRLQTESLVDPLYTEQKTFKEKYPLNSFLKGPKIAKQREQLKKLGLQYDPDAFPRIDPTDPDLAEYSRHRTGFDDAADRRESQAHSDSDDEHYGTKNQATKSHPHIMADAIGKSHKRLERKHGKLPDHLEYRDRRVLGAQQRELQKAIKKQGLDPKSQRDWVELMRDPSVRGREVSARMYAQHSADFEEHLHRAEPRRRDNRGDRKPASAPAGDGDGGEGGEGPDERQDAKFEGTYEEGTEGGSGDGGANRKNRDKKQKGRRGGKDVTKFGDAGQSKSPPVSISDELARAKKDRSGEPLVIGADGQALSGSWPADKQLTEKEYKIARMMASLSPEERQNLHQLYSQQRIDQLEGLRQMAKTGDGIDSETLAELANADLGRKVVQAQAPSTSSQHQVRSEAAYIERQLREEGRDIDHIPDEDEKVKSKKMMDLSKVGQARRKRQYEKDLVEKQAEQRHSGAWFRKYQTQADKLEADEEVAQGMRSTGKMLDEFISDQAPVLKDDEDDQDIYSQYLDMAGRSKENKDSEDQRKPDFSNFMAGRNKQEEHKPEMPRFQDYFDAEADGIHPFDKVTYNTGGYGDEELDQEERQAEAEREKQLYNRQLIGKLIGQTLTPAEYEKIAGFQADTELRNKRMLDTNNEEFLHARHNVRLMEEQAERYRRRKVLTGEWREAESRDKLQQYIEEMQEEQDNEPDTKTYIRDLTRYLNKLKYGASPDNMLEKEYHFDESVGVSLESHIAQLKSDHPGARIQTRRDRDGYAIVKVSHKPEFKYDLDAILASDPESIELRKAETLEAILRATSPQDISGQEKLAQLDPAQIEQGIKVLTGQDTFNAQVQLSQEDRLAVRRLAKEAAFGRYKDDADGFVQELNELGRQISSRKNSKLVVGQDDMDVDMSVSGMMNDLFEDRERFRAEIADQIRSRVQEHVYGKERKMEDFVKPKFNEERAQVRKTEVNDENIANIERQVAEEDEDGENFDREAFDKLKAELKQRKKLKEDMLTGTIPRFKPYLRI